MEEPQTSLEPLQQVCPNQLNLVFLLRILLRSAGNLQNVRKEKFVFLLWLSANLPETPKRHKENSLIAHSKCSLNSSASVLVKHSCSGNLNCFHPLLYTGATSVELMLKDELKF